MILNILEDHSLQIMVLNINILPSIRFPKKKKNTLQITDTNYSF